MRKSRRQREIEWKREWGDLSRYNDEVAHGIVHRPDYVFRMQMKQRRYDQQRVAELEAEGYIVSRTADGRLTWRRPQ